MKPVFSAIQNGFRNCLDLKAQASRTDFWLFFLTFTLLFFAAFGADVSYVQQPATIAAVPQFLADLFNAQTPFSRLYLLLFTLPMISFAVRRIYDSERPSWAGMAAVVPFLSMALIVL
ncbi:MAG: DUF805 domain-containing protein [Cohaesibacter sp.]|nr:DUF805 domain-containing protein [Cohaesibacter sp.]